jgi:hypothetical protein
VRHLPYVCRCDISDQTLDPFFNRSVVVYSVIYGLPKKEEEQLQYTPLVPCWAQYSVPFVELGKYSL